MKLKYIYFSVNMTKERALLIYIVDILTRKCELVRLPLEDNEFIHWPYVLQGHLEMHF